MRTWGIERVARAPGPPLDADPVTPAAVRDVEAPDGVAVSNSVAADPASFEGLADCAREVAACTRCRLAGTRTQTVFGVGNPQARLMIVGEAPGRDEDLKGEPFVGRAGQLLDKIIAAMGLARGDVYIANILKCRPPENRDPLADEVGSCTPYLERQIELIQPEVILALGKTVRELPPRDHGLPWEGCGANAIRSGAEPCT